MAFEVGENIKKPCFNADIISYTWKHTFQVRKGAWYEWIVQEATVVCLSTVTTK